jgi:hypothetical protein
MTLPRSRGPSQPVQHTCKDQLISGQCLMGQQHSILIKDYKPCLQLETINSLITILCSSILFLYITNEFPCFVLGGIILHKIIGTKS